REIARLKRQQKEQEKRIGYLAAENRKTGKASAADQLNGSMRFSARSMRAQRRRSGLSAADYAQLVGVSPLTIYNWEHGHSRPRNAQFASLVSLRGLGKRQAQLKLSEIRPRSSKPRVKKPK